MDRYSVAKFFFLAWSFQNFWPVIALNYCKTLLLLVFWLLKITEELLLMIPARQFAHLKWPVASHTSFLPVNLVCIAYTSKLSLMHILSQQAQLSLKYCDFWHLSSPIHLALSSWQRHAARERQTHQLCPAYPSLESCHMVSMFDQPNWFHCFILIWITFDLSLIISSIWLSCK